MYDYRRGKTRDQMSLVGRFKVNCGKASEGRRVGKGQDDLHDIDTWIVK
jgi:hypothetical protein